MSEPAPSQRLGSYELIALIGKGGMGEVWRAHDTRLNRDVAIKFCSQQFSERFEREARAIAALNHPNICTLYDVGPINSGPDSPGVSGGQDAESPRFWLVMELVEGPTLADRIKEGPIPLEEALNIARQVADALETAHEKGIVHRDLKPGNIKIKPNGTVKVLDFGLAKMGGTPSVKGDESPTLTVGQTEAGVILGTASYMSPEQAKGKQVDQRADIYAFGAVLYEMLTGRRLHRGETTTEVLASVIKEEPHWDKVPVQVQKLLKRCLEKDPQKRLRHIGDVMSLVDEAPAPRAPASAARAEWPWIAAGAAVLAVAAGVIWYLRLAPDQPLLQLDITPPDGVKIEATITPFALSPDGKRLVFVATGRDGRSMLWLRPINASSAIALAGTENGEVPFWSPDSKWIGFSANGKLQKLNIGAASQPQLICEIQGRAGGTWNRDGVIVFDQGGKPLQRVSADGGTPTPLLQLDASRQEAYHGAPYFLPDGRHLLYYGTGKQGVKIMLGSLDGKLNRVLVDGAGAVTYAPNPHGSGSILYNVGGQLLARPFDLGKLDFTGPPAVIADGVGVGRWWYPSSNGLLAFRHSYGTQYQLAWFSRDGRALGTVADPGSLSTPRISPDQKTIAFTRASDQNLDVWMFDLERNTSARFTFNPGFDGHPIWSPDGGGIIFASGPINAVTSVFERPANGVGGEKLIVGQNGSALIPTGMSHDSRWLVLTEASPLHTVVVLHSLNDPNVVIRVQDRESERDGSISPDGRWLLYSSSPASRREVLVQSMPKEAGGSAGAVGKWQISTAGGGQPAWRGDGKEIFYVAPDGMMMAVPVESGEDFFRPGAPNPLFQTRLAFDAKAGQFGDYTRQYDVTADGQRFLLNQHVADSTDAPITVVVNWPKLLEKTK